MKSIYASKLYKASPRKERIQAALLSSANRGLVQQLAADLDEEFQAPEYLDKDVNNEQDVKEIEEENLGFDDLVVDEEINPATDLMTMDDLATTKTSKSSSPHSGGHVTKLDESLKPDSEVDTKDLMPDSPATDLNNKEEAVASTTITSTTQVNPTQIAQCALEDLDLNVIKGTLNGREDTCGVNRISEKDNEVWMYYNDDINLNDKMTNVIEYIANAGFDNLEFNRLARSDNAIVFVVTKTVRDYPDKSIDSGQKSA